MQTERIKDIFKENKRQFDLLLEAIDRETKDLKSKKSDTWINAKQYIPILKTRLKSIKDVVTTIPIKVVDIYTADGLDKFEIANTIRIEFAGATEITFHPKNTSPAAGSESWLEVNYYRDNNIHEENEEVKTIEEAFLPIVKLTRLIHYDYSLEKLPNQVLRNMLIEVLEGN